MKAAYQSAGFVADRRVAFNLRGNDYRLVVAVRYDRRLMYVRFVGSHRQCDRIDVETIQEADMELKRIRSNREYQAALAEVERLWDAPAKSAEADRLDVLAILVECYERQYFPIADPGPIEFLGHVMEGRGMTRKDMEAYIGPRGGVADILNRNWPLTLEMIRRLADRLHLPAEVLIKPYRLRQEGGELEAA